MIISTAKAEALMREMADRLAARLAGAGDAGTQNID